MTADDIAALYPGRQALDAQFTLDGIADLPAVRARREAAGRDALAMLPAPEIVSYGPDPDERLTIFRSQDSGASPTLVFVHGGFWVSMEARQFAFLAPGFVPFGATVALLDYPLIPKVRIGDIVSSCCRALEWCRRNGADHGIDPKRIHISGNSAGGHLVAEMADAIPHAVRGVTAISGLYDLAPVAASFMNAELGFTADEVARHSPLRRPVLHRIPTILAVGGRETREFLRQTTEFAAHLGRARVAAESMIVPETDHITVVLDGLSDPDAPLNRAVRRSMGL